ncbi:MAG TPA: CDP-alcohol phosphatidyltransferase family protein [Thermomicrobiales bacterium]|nr:CDP-alcohol phosphatidyltransferase family protein [Thermomicrobiales bacterium]
MINEHLQEWGRAQARRVARWLQWTGLSPNALTLIGLLLNVGVAVVLALGYLRLGGVLVLVAGLFDMLDGAMAKVTNRITTFGSFLDSTLDRYSEAILYAGLLFYVLTTRDARLGAVLIYVTICGSLLVSYARARAEALGYKLQVGLLARPERIIVLAVGLLLAHPLWALWFLAIFTNVTAIQRIYHLWATVYRQPRDRRRP